MFQERNFLLRCAFLALFIAFTTAQNHNVIVNTTKGHILGKMSMVQTSIPRDPEERIISTFLGVPYAKPPIGNLRFQPPVPHDKWEGVRNATSYGNACNQMVWGMEFVGYPNGPYGDEDCLFLNVFVPGDPRNITEPLSVMVWIYGGGFMQGFSHLYDPTEMVLHGNVIVVTFNYRLGAFGFLSIDEQSSTSSNNALRDQIMVLSWIRDNIANFGGNPHKVTIFGESAGSISASLLLVSPLSKGLFKRAIAQSGAQGAAIQNKCHGIEQRDYARKSLIPRSNCTFSNMSETVACLKYAKSSIILAHQFDFDFDGDIFSSAWDIQFIPCYGDDVIPRKPAELTKSGEINVEALIIGGNNDDGVYSFNSFAPVNKTIFEKSLEYLIKTFYPLEWERVYAALLHEYSPYKEDMYARQLVNAQTDRFFADFQILSDDVSSNNRTVYNYIFNYSPQSIPFYPSWVTGGHGAEVFLEIVNVLDLNVTLTPEDVEVAKTLLTAFTNFAKTGDPNDRSMTLTWPKYDVVTRQSFEITSNTTSDSIKSNPRRKAMDFWNNLVPLLAEPDVCPVPTTEPPVTTVAPPSDCLLPGCVSFVTVNTTNGQLRGYVFLVQTDSVPEARRISKFLGIPYAKPPIGDLRFADPVGTDPWDGVQNATTFGHMCPQIIPPEFGLGLSGTAGNEDCLSLNVYIPGNVEVTKQLSVMVWIHGGGFVLGSGSQYDPTQIALHGNVIVVTINYRLGVFGRVSTDGNYANNYLKDQVLALKWVQENIAYFGGSPSDVTVFGESAGGISVNYLLISPLANGLFKRAISQSAVFANVLASQAEERCVIRQYLKVLARRVNCTYEPILDFDCLRTSSHDNLLNYQFSDNYGEFSTDFTDVSGVLLPMCYGDDALPQNPIDMFKAGRMHNTTESVIIGGNNDEGAFLTNTFAPVNRTSFEQLISFALLSTQLPNHEEVLPVALHEYEPYAENQMYNRQAMNAMSDKVIAEFQAVADEISSYSYQPNVYHYIFNYTPVTRVIPYADWIQGGHGEEILVEFGNVLDPNVQFPVSQSDKEVSRFIMTFITNFAKTGNPNPLYGPYAGVNWPLYSVNTRYSLEITGNITSDSVKSHPRRKGMEFWNEIVLSVAKLKQCPVLDTTSSLPDTTTVPADSCHTAIGPLSLNAEEAHRLLWGLGLSLGFVIIFAVILVAALIKCSRNRKSFDTKL